MKYALPLLIFLLPACSSVPVNVPNKDIFYREDMDISVGGYVGKGTLVVPKQEAENFKFDVRLPGVADVFLLSTCHRAEVWEKPGEKGFFGDKKRVQFDYDPLNGLETGGSCLLSLRSINANGQHAFGTVDFEGSDATLPAVVKCNGEHYQSRGVTICQSKEGLIQEITFPGEVAYSPDPGCPLKLLPGYPKEGRIFRWNIQPRQCQYAFIEVAPARRIHRLTTKGWQEVIIRGQ